MSRAYHMLTCTDLARIGMWQTRDCCGSCHDDYSEGWQDEMCMIYLPTHNSREPMTLVHVCCKAWEANRHMTRNDAARALWAKWRGAEERR